MKVINVCEVVRLKCCMSLLSPVWQSDHCSRLEQPGTSWEPGAPINEEWSEIRKPNF